MPRLYLLEHEHTRVLRQAELDWVRSLIADIRAGRLTWPDYLEWGQQDGETPVSPVSPASREMPAPGRDIAPQYDRSAADGKTTAT